MFNDTITLTRHSNVVVSNFHAGASATINAMGAASYLEVAVSGITQGGTLVVHGEDENGMSINETITFSQASTQLSTNEFSKVTSLVPSWGSYTININAVDVQGAPVMTKTLYGPYPCSMAYKPLSSIEGEVGVPGRLRGLRWRGYILVFEPHTGDEASTGLGIEGVIEDVTPILLPNCPCGWNFLLQENPG